MYFISMCNHFILPAEGRDYMVRHANYSTESRSVNITFAPDDDTAEITVSILNDTLLEGSEMFTAVLSNISRNLEFSPAMTTITINDRKLLY